MPDLNRVQSPVERQGYIQILGDRLAFPETSIHAEIRKFRMGNAKTQESAHSDKQIVDRKLTALEKAQRIMIRFSLNNPEIMAEVEKSGGKELFCDKKYKEIYQMNYLLREAGHNIKAEDLISHLDDGARELLTEILLENDLPQDKERIYQDCITTLTIDLVNKKITEKNSLMKQYEKNGDVTKSLEIMAQVQELIRDRQRLVSTLRNGGNGLEN
jgi:hypothetical protein